MEYEDYLACEYTPLKAIIVLSDVIYTKCNEDWNIFSGEKNRKDGEELLALNYAIKLCAEHLLYKRNIESKNI